MRGSINKKRGVSVHSLVAPLSYGLKISRTSGITSFSARTPSYMTIINDDSLVSECLGGYWLPVLAAIRGSLGRYRTDFRRAKWYSIEAMGQADDTPKKIGKLVDRIEQIREDLLAIQRSMEKMETVKTIMSDERVKKK
jgi:hypothetical protein